jgi:hypothetical protein
MILLSAESLQESREYMQVRFDLMLVTWIDAWFSFWLIQSNFRDRSADDRQRYSKDNRVESFVSSLNKKDKESEYYVKIDN